MSEKFWAVWKRDGGGSLHERFTKHSEAVKAAKHLAKNSGESYYILEANEIVELTCNPIHDKDFKWYPSSPLKFVE